MTNNPGQPIEVLYLNYKGDTSVRRILPLMIWYGSTECHPNEQWFIRAFDLDKQAILDFAFTGFVRPNDRAIQELCHIHAVEVQEICQVHDAQVQELRNKIAELEKAVSENYDTAHSHGYKAALHHMGKFLEDTKARGK
jgi:hypothetical protein